MKKKILILSASPRKKGNSELLCGQFALGAKESGHEVEKISIAGKKIHYCTGCGACFNTSQCSQKDDMSGILEKMIASDVIVMATPVYFYTMNGQMKTLIDRTCARYREITDKEFYFIVTAADDNKQAMKRTIEEFRGFTYCLDGAKEKGILYGVGAWNIGEVVKTDSYPQAFEMGKAV
jgi:multimeric flavodoxin WrbA